MIRSVFLNDHFDCQVKEKGEERQSRLEKLGPTLEHVPRYSNENMEQG